LHERRLQEFLQLTKPRTIWLILMRTGIGYFFGLHGGWKWMTLLHTMLGTGLLASGTATLNQWYEREADRLMRRAVGRPLPQGKMTPAHVLAFGGALSVAGFLDLWLGVNLLAAAIGAFTLASYLLYTPMKQRTQRDFRPFLELVEKAPHGERDAVTVMGPGDLPRIRRVRRAMAASCNPHLMEDYPYFTGTIRTLQGRR
jgi:hypothetical protein